MKPGTAKSRASVQPADTLTGDVDTSRKLQQLAVELESGLRTRARRSTSQTSRTSSRSGRSPSVALVEAKADKLRADRLRAQQVEAKRPESVSRASAAAKAQSRLEASRSRTPSFSDPARPVAKFGQRPSAGVNRLISGQARGQPQERSSQSTAYLEATSHNPSDRRSLPSPSAKAIARPDPQSALRSVARQRHGISWNAMHPGPTDELQPCPIPPLLAFVCCPRCVI